MQTETERFWSKVEKTATCWLWTASVNGWGYGRFVTGGRVNHREWMAHAYAYTTLVGPIPADRPTLDHICRVRRCVNPAHLEPVPAKVNTARGLGAPAINARKAYCAKGHPYDETNTLVDAKGWRRCRTCNRAWHSAPDRVVKRRLLRRAQTVPKTVFDTERLDAKGHKVGRRAYNPGKPYID